MLVVVVKARQADNGGRMVPAASLLDWETKADSEWLMYKKEKNRKILVMVVVDEMVWFPVKIQGFTMIRHESRLRLYKRRCQKMLR